MTEFLIGQLVYLTEDGASDEAGPSHPNVFGFKGQVGRVKEIYEDGSGVTVVPLNKLASQVEEFPLSMAQVKRL